MTTPPQEAVEQVLNASQAPSEVTPAQQALTVALAFAAAAQVGVEQRCRAWLAGRISATDLAYSGATAVLQGVAKALLAAEHFAALEWATRISPRTIPSTEHARLTAALRTVVRDAERARTRHLTTALAEVSKVSQLSEGPEVSEVSDTLVMRAIRLAHAEVVIAGRVGYGQAVEQVVAADPDYAWRFDLSPDPCGRCFALAAQTFPTFAQVPKQGAHPGCRCAAQVEMRTP